MRARARCARSLPRRPTRGPRWPTRVDRRASPAAAVPRWPRPALPPAPRIRSRTRNSAEVRLSRAGRRTCARPGLPPVRRGDPPRQPSRSKQVEHGSGPHSAPAARPRGPGRSRRERRCPRRSPPRRPAARARRAATLGLPGFDPTPSGRRAPWRRRRRCRRRRPASERTFRARAASAIEHPSPDGCSRPSRTTVSQKWTEAHDGREASRGSGRWFSVAHVLSKCGTLTARGRRRRPTGSRSVADACRLGGVAERGTLGDLGVEARPRTASAWGETRGHAVDQTVDGGSVGQVSANEVQAGVAQGLRRAPRSGSRVMPRTANPPASRCRATCAALLPGARRRRG